MLLEAAALMLAQTAPCTATDAALPAPLSAWTTPGRGNPDNLATPVVLKAMPSEQVRGLPAGARPGGAAALDFRIDAAGLYGIALDQPGRIDVIPAAGGVPLQSVKHGHGPACSTIRKIVRFDLQPGRYRLALTGLTRPQAKLMLVAPQ